VFAGLALQIWASRGYDLAIVPRASRGHASHGEAAAAAAGGGATPESKKRA